VYMMLGATWHIQMTYYIFLLIGILFFVELYKHFKDKKIKNFIISSLVFLAAVGIGMGTRTGYFMMNQHHVKETMRGGHSELTQGYTGEESKGLDLDYATAWSYDIDETLTLLIPNFKGGASGAKLSKNSNTYKALVQHGQSPREAERIISQMPMYWGTQPFTAGPVYVGAVIFILFVLALFVVKGPYKWGLLIATIFSILLAWGRNFMPFTEFFMNYFPFYNKFRAVSSILVVAEFTIPLLGFLALKNIIENKISKDELLQHIKMSAYITGGICLFFVLFGSAIFSFTSAQDVRIFANWPEWLSDAIIQDRKAWLRMDALRSAVFVGLTALLLFYFVKGKIKLQSFYIALIVLILADMWPINKRYLNNDKFVPLKNVETPFPLTEADRLILQDPDPHYRVLNITTNTFNDAATSFWHKSIGGYSPAKLRRYQDMIEYHIGRNNVRVFNMLNTKYFIVPGPDGAPEVQRNVSAMGNAWFVDSVRIVEGPNAEINALYDFDPASVAIIDTSFARRLLPFTSPSENATIHLTSYAPNILTYRSSNENDGLAVFSEIFYPDEWFAWINGEPVEILRVNYILRAINIPAGEHEIRMEFIPVFKNKGDRIGLIFNLMLFALIAVAVYVQFRKPKTKA
ncbi:MAG: YfhO family protein, partial [Bacteroidales bacterium]|nr:YfhO family protein [Bacteroidales bacterium]